MAWTAPTVAAFKTFFARDFHFASDNDPNNTDFIIDGDITRAQSEAKVNFNSALLADDDKTTIAFHYLTAFCLVRNIQNSTKGLSSQTRFPISSTSVGGVSVSYQIPERYAKDPYICSFAQNGYGMRYLELTLSYLKGHVVPVAGGTDGIEQGGFTT